MPDILLPGEEEQRQKSFLARALGKGKAKKLEEDPRYFDWMQDLSQVENLSLGFAPGPLAGGMFKTPVLTGLIRELNKHPDLPIALRRVALQRMKNFLREVPQDVMDILEAVKTVPGRAFETTPYPRTTGLFWGKGEFRGNEPVIWLRELGDIPTEKMGPLSRSPLDYIATAQHEIGHTILEALKRKAGLPAHYMASRSGKGMARHGVEEPFASEMEWLSPKEFAERIAPYGKALRQPSMPSGKQWGRSLRKAIKKGKVK